MHRSHPDGETEACSIKVIYKGPMPCGKQSQAWHLPSSYLNVAPCCIAHYDPHHTSKMSPLLKGGEHPPSGVCMCMSHTGRAKSWALSRKNWAETTEAISLQTRAIIPPPETTALHMLSPPVVEICSHMSSPQSCHLPTLWAASRKVSWHGQPWTI